MGRPKKSAPVLHEPEEDFSQDVPDEEPARVIDEDESDDAPESNGSISKAQAVRNALAEGHEEPSDIADFARKRYGLEISNQQVSAYKSQTKARARKNGTADADDGGDDQGGASKTDLIRKALEAGYEKPARGVEYIQREHGVEIDPKYFSIVKGKLGKVEPKDDPAKAEAPEPKVAPAQPAGRIERATVPTGAIPASLFDDLKLLRRMKDNYGDDFEKMVEAIG